MFIYNTRTECRLFNTFDKCLVIEIKGVSEVEIMVIKIKTKIKMILSIVTWWIIIMKAKETRSVLSSWKFD